MRVGENIDEIRKRGNCSDSRKANKMKNYLPDEDTVLNTLQGVPGCLGKLEYINSLRDESGTVRHWGLEKIHGAERTCAEFEAAYERTLIELIKTPVQELWKELVESCGVNERSPQTFVLEFRNKILQHIPAGFGEAQRRHVRQVLDVVFALAENSRS